jgi:hypothetical protein
MLAAPYANKKSFFESAIMCDINVTITWAQITSHRASSMRMTTDQPQSKTTVQRQSPRWFPLPPLYDATVEKVTKPHGWKSTAATWKVASASQSLIVVVRCTHVVRMQGTPES